MKLGTLLIRDGVINLDQLEAALRQQVLFGGKLGTNLVELGHISLDTLAMYLGRTLGFPAATRTQFEGADPEVRAHVPAELAERHLAFPLELQRDDGHPILAVAMADPHDQAALATLGEAAGMPIRPHIAPELRILFYLERHYGLRRKLRFVRVAPPAPPVPSATTPWPSPDRRRVVGAQEMATGMLVEPARGMGRGTIPPPLESRPTRITAEDAVRVIAAAKTREHVADAMLAYARGRLEFCVVFLVRDGLAIGWRGIGPGLDNATLGTMCLSLEARSCLASAHDIGHLYAGQPEPGARDLDERLWAELGAPVAPEEILVGVVGIGDRVVNLVYGFTPGRGALDPDTVDGLEAVTLAARDAYKRLILAAKDPG